MKAEKVKVKLFFLEILYGCTFNFLQTDLMCTLIAK